VPTFGCPAKGISRLGVKYPHAGSMRSVLRRQHKCRFTVSELAGDCLHLFSRQASGAKHDGDWIALELLGCKTIAGDVASIDGCSGSLVVFASLDDRLQAAKATETVLPWQAGSAESSSQVIDVDGSAGLFLHFADDRLCGMLSKLRGPGKTPEVIPLDLVQQHVFAVKNDSCGPEIETMTISPKTSSRFMESIEARRRYGAAS